MKLYEEENPKEVTCQRYVNVACVPHQLFGLNGAAHRSGCRTWAQGTVGDMCDHS